MKIAMLSPYSLSRPGGVQGQVLGLARALRKPGPPGHRGRPRRSRTTSLQRVTAGGERTPDPDVFVMGRPDRAALQRLGGSGDDLARWRPCGPSASCARAGSTCCTCTSRWPRSPLRLRGHAPVPMVGTYHRAGVSRWVPVLKPLVYGWWGRACRCAWPSPKAARETAMRSSKGEYEVLFNGVDMERFARAEPVPSDRPTVLFLGRHETRKGLSVLLDAFAAGGAAGRVVGGRGRAAERGAAPPPSRVGPGQVAGHPERRGGDGPPAGGRRPVRAVPARRVVRHGGARGHGGPLRRGGVGSPAGYRSAAGGHAVLVPPGDVAPCRARWAWRWPTPAEGSGQSSPEALKAAEAHAEGWSMERLAERYVDVYERAIAKYRQQHS
jgi:hypothetical protein